MAIHDGKAAGPEVRIAGLPVRSVLGVALAVLVVVILGVRFVASRQSSSVNVPSGTAPIVGHRAPGLLLRDLKSNPVSLKSFQGKIVVLNFWYAECPPCQVELPALEHTYQQDASQGVVIVGANTLDDASTISSYVKQVGLTYPVFLDNQGATAVAYGVIQTPTTFVIDREGIIRAKLSGPVTRQSLGNALAPLLTASK